MMIAGNVLAVNWPSNMLFHNVLRLWLLRIKSLGNLRDTKLLLEKETPLRVYSNKNDSMILASEAEYFAAQAGIPSLEVHHTCSHTCLVENKYKHTSFLILWCMLLLGLTLEMFAAKNGCIVSLPVTQVTSLCLREKNEAPDIEGLW